MDSTSFLAPISQKTLADTVTVRLRQAIISGHLGPGEKLAETELADRMQVSRSPIREALRRLMAEGLVQQETNSSCYVWEPTTRDVDEIMSLRTSVESLAAEWAIHKLDEDDFTRMKAIIEQHQRAMPTGDYLELIEQERQFHEYVCRRAEHARLLKWWRQIIHQWQLLVHRYMMQHPPDVILGTALEDHEAIIQALRDRELNKVLTLHRDINLRLSERVKRILND